jgi:outer membrane beta-barrel protein
MKIEIGKRTQRRLVSLGVVAAILAVASVAAAQEDEVARPLHQGRFMLQADGDYSFTPASISHVGVGVAAGYYFTDALAIGVSGRYWISGSLPTPSPSLGPLQQKWFNTDLDLSYVLFSTARGEIVRPSVPFDLYLASGVGVIATRPVPEVDPKRDFDPKVRVDTHVAVGTRFFVTPSIALSAEVRDLIYSDQTESQTTGPAAVALGNYGPTRLVNDLQVGVGVSVWLPVL